MRKRIVVLTGAVAISAGLAMPATSGAATFDWLNQAGYSPGQIGKFLGAQGLATDPAGNLLFSDAASRWQKFEPDGTPIMTGGWGVNNLANNYQTCTSYCAQGIQGSGPGQLNSPYGIDSDSQGNIWVSDYNLNRMVKYDASGNYVATFGSTGSGNGEFNSPVDLKIDSADNIYVSDQGNNRVQVFNTAGVYQSQFGTPGTGNGEFNGPTGLAFTSSNAVYVVDKNNQRVQLFNSAGVYQSQFGTAGSADGELNSPSYIAIDPSGDLYVSDTGNNRIQRFSSARSYEDQWASDGADVMAFTNGSLYASENQFGNRVIQAYSPTGDQEFAFGSPRGADPGIFYNPVAAATDQSGNVYVIDQTLNIVNRFNPSLGFVSRWGGSGSGDGRLNSPYGLTVDKNDRVIVADSMNLRIQIFSSTGAYESQFDGSDAQSGPFQGVVSVATDTSGNIYTTDAQKEIVQKFSPEGDFITEWGQPGTGPEQFDNPYGVAVDQNGFVYVADTTNGRIQKFTSTGDYLTQWNTNLTQPYSVAVDPITNNVFVGDRGDRDIQIFTGDGTPVQSFGSNGFFKNQYDQIGGIAVDCAGNVYVSDSDDSARVQKIGDPSAGSPVCGSDSGGGTGGGGNSGGGGGTAAVAPKLTGFNMAPTRFRANGKRCTKIKKGKKKGKCAPVGSQITYTLNEQAEMNMWVDQVIKGKRVGSKCKRKTRSNRKKRTCTIYKRKYNFKRLANAGTSKIKFSGKYGKRTLRPGVYRLSAVAKSSNGLDSAPIATKTFRILRR